MNEHISTRSIGAFERNPFLRDLGDGKSNEAQKISLYHHVVLFIISDIFAVAFFGKIIITLLTYLGYEFTEYTSNYWIPIIFAIGVYALMAKSIGIYEVKKILDEKYATRMLFIGLSITFAALITVAVATKTEYFYSRLWFFAWAGSTCVLVPVGRRLALGHVRRRLENGAFVAKAISASIFADPLDAKEIAKNSSNEVRVVRTVRMESLSELEGLADTIARDEIDQIYLVVPWAEAAVVLKRMLSLRQFAADVFVLPDDQNVRALHLGVSTLSDRLSLKAVDRPIDGWNIWLKRVQDIVLSGSILLFLAPVLAVIALAIKIDSPGPVFFRQKRVGFNGRRFELWKFRSMYVEATDKDATCQTARGDSRVTRVGRFIRRTSMDELPQFFNVLEGSMSVVGPRPHALMTQAEGYALEEVADQYAARHRVKPGITGLAQVSGCRGELDTIEKVNRRVAYDIEYIENWCTWLDVKIVLRTALLVFYDPAAY